MTATLRSTVGTLTILSAGAIGMSVGGRDLDAALATRDEGLVSRVEQLTRTIDELTRRLSALENTTTQQSGAQASQRVTAPFEVVDRLGNVILSVTDSSYGGRSRGRVHIGPDTAGQAYGLWVRDADGMSAVVLREQASGAGGVYVMDKTGIDRVVLSANDDGGITVVNAARREVVSIGPDPKARGPGMLRVVGALQLIDARGATLLDVQENSRSIAAPFGVTDKSGDAVLSVSDAVYDAALSKGRVHIGREGGDNFMLWVRKDDRTLAATIGETKEGGGRIAAYGNEGKIRADLSGSGTNGVNVYDESGKAIASLKLHDADPSAVLLRMTGGMQLFDKAGKVMVEAGGSKAGMGMVGAYAKDGTIRGLLTGDGVEVRSPSGKDVASLSLDRRSSEGGVVAVTGLMQIFDAKGTTTVEMGTVPAGVGVVRVGPVFRCGQSAQVLVANMPTCMMGLVK